MDTYVSDQQIDRYFRRIQLGLRLLAHGARTQTTCQWTGLTPDQLATLRRRWQFNADERLRGPSPSSFDAFFASRHRRTEAALFLQMCMLAGVVPLQHGPESASSLPSLENGERLCEAYEMYRAWEPHAGFTIEQATLLLLGAVSGQEIELTQCPDCNGALLIDKLSQRRSGCPYCRKKHARRPSARLAAAALGA